MSPSSFIGRKSAIFHSVEGGTGRKENIFLHGAVFPFYS